MSGTFTWICVHPECDGVHHYYVAGPVVLGEVIGSTDG